MRPPSSFWESPWVWQSATRIDKVQQATHSSSCSRLATVVLSVAKCYKDRQGVWGHALVVVSLPDRQLVVNINQIRVQLFATGPLDQEKSINGIWKAVKEHIQKNGGTTSAGVTTLKKRWLAIRNQPAGVSAAAGSSAAPSASRTRGGAARTGSIHATGSLTRSLPVLSQRTSTGTATFDERCNGIMACQRSTKWTSHPDSRAAEILFLLNLAQLLDDGYYVDVDHGIPQAQLDGQDER
ncbi:hypothetical protein J7T55_009745 [Diaporthe amygdali]|uniref:uncharacterized protein n=1 Tax=Phomopsis amygdali TaxID=1214568 RepID=UPI0022FDD67A|nr:uncharacterized protein J7T55_009745 [Diaporthe amygdali]KAJ0116595.1 hypothetical protein J7T55_009745 [Diaporthe amygdali]